MKHDRLAFWSEKLPLTLAMLAQALVVSRWYLGSDVPASVAEIVRWLNVLVAAGAGLALDLVVVTTVMARRDGRRSGWGVATAVAAAGASALIALDVYGGWTPGPYLHVAYPVVVFFFAMHLSSPRNIDGHAQWLTQRRALVRRLVRTLRSTRTDLAHLEVHGAQAGTTAAQLAAQLQAIDVQRAQDRATAAQDLTQRDRVIAQLRTELTQEREAAAQNKQEAPASLLTIAQTLIDSGVSARKAAQLVGMSESTLRNKLKAATNGHIIEGVSP